MVRNGDSSIIASPDLRVHGVFLGPWTNCSYTELVPEPIELYQISVLGEGKVTRTCCSKCGCEIIQTMVDSRLDILPDILRLILLLLGLLQNKDLHWYSY